MSKKALSWSPLFVIATVSGVAVLACGAGSNGVDGTSSLVNTTPEPAGANCPNGGTKVDVGNDTNSNGTLDSGEIKQTRYVCAGSSGTNGTNGADGTSGKDGKDGTSYLITTASEPAGTNCPEGGTKIQSGADANANGVLDGTEATTTYVCNGGDPNGDGGPQAISYYAGGNAFTASVAGTTVTPLSGSITVPESGSVVAIASVDLFCASPAIGGGYDCGSGITDGFLTLSTSATDAAASASYDFVYLSPNSTESLNRTAVFPVTAGTSTFYLRGEAVDGQIGFFRSQITLLFIPHA